jgi:hypothetical protein
MAGDPHRLPTIGWREWLQLPELPLPWIKCKVDTGARSSSLHAIELEYENINDVTFVKFAVQPHQGTSEPVVTCLAPVSEFRRVRSSNGVQEERPVIVTTCALRGFLYPLELTLTDRQQMGFRMLLGREAIRGRFVVDCNRSYLAGRPMNKG